MSNDHSTNFRYFLYISSGATFCYDLICNATAAGIICNCTIFSPHVLETTCVLPNVSTTRAALPKHLPAANPLRQLPQLSHSQKRALTLLSLNHYSVPSSGSFLQKWHRLLLPAPCCMPLLPSLCLLHTTFTLLIANLLHCCSSSSPFSPVIESQHNIDVFSLLPNVRRVRLRRGPFSSALVALEPYVFSLPGAYVLFFAVCVFHLMWISST